VYDTKRINPQIGVVGSPRFYARRSKMAQITRIDVRIKTGDRPGAGTDGGVFLGICGRELLLDTNENDFERGLDQTFTLGMGSNSRYPERSDPSKPFPLDTGDLDSFPMWIRFEPESSDDAWNVEAVVATVNPRSTGEKYGALPREENVWLGKPFGRYWFLLKKLKQQR
jgi:hypothetical protein